MAMTRTALRSQLSSRLESIATNWSSAELSGILDTVIEGLYPVFYKLNVTTTTAGAGPTQTMPGTARNLYMIGLQRSGSNRVRPLRNWVEGAGTALVPKANIAGATLVWAWTSGWDAPATDVAPLDIPSEAKEVILLRCEIAALEQLLATRLQKGQYLAVQVREGVTEDDIVNALQAKHASLQDRIDNVVKLPEIQR